MAQGEHNYFVFLKGKVYKWEVLCLLDTRAFHNFVTQNSAKRMELQLEEIKAPIDVHFANGIPHPITLQARDVPLRLGNWNGKVDLFMVSTLREWNAFWEWSSLPIFMTSLNTYIYVIEHCFMPIFESFDIISQSIFYAVQHQSYV